MRSTHRPAPPWNPHWTAHDSRLLLVLVLVAVLFSLEWNRAPMDAVAPDRTAQGAPGVPDGRRSAAGASDAQVPSDGIGSAKAAGHATPQ